MRFAKDKQDNEEIISYIQGHLDDDVARLIDDEELDMAGKTVTEFDEDEVFTKIMTKIRHKERSFAKSLIRWAAVFISLISLGAVTYYISKEDTPQLNEIYAKNGEKLIVILADGSRVNLNSDSKLIYPDHFSGVTRRVKLIGEGYFSVKKDSEHPFIVDTYDMMVKVTGTKFNIRAYPEDENIITTLDEGKVFVGKNERNPHLRSLHPGERAVYNKLTASCNVFNMNNHIEASSWTSNQFIVRNENLRSIIHMMERNYDVKIRVTDPSIYKYTYNINCDAHNIENVIEIMETITPVRFKNIGNHCYELN